MIYRNRTIHRVTRWLGLATVFFGVAAVPAVAAPSFGIELERDSAEFPTVNRGDERVDYTVKVKNVALPLSGAANSGERLFCNGAAPPVGTKASFPWFRESTTNYSYTFQWVRNGLNLESAKDLANGSQSRFYAVQAADEGKALQCVVKGTNGAKSGSFIIASQPVAVVNPQPAVEPPQPNNPAGFDRRPTIVGSASAAGEELTCAAPVGGWSVSEAASPITWTFKWFRNGVERSGTPGSYPFNGEVTATTATSSKFKIAGSELDTKAVFQCESIATNAGGAAIVESIKIETTDPAPAFVENTEDGAPAASEPPSLERAGNTIVDPVTVELELPGGMETYALKAEGRGWACDRAPASGAQHARAICTTSGILFPTESYDPINVVTALGADVPDIAVAKATVSGGAVPVSDEDEFVLGPGIPFGLTAFEAKVIDSEGKDYTQAGGHALAGIARLAVTSKRRLGPERDPQGEEVDTAKFVPVEQLKQVFTELPRGFVGSAEAVPQLCPSVSNILTQTCPPGSRVGFAFIFFSGTTEQGNTFPIYAIEPEFGNPIQFGIPDPFGDVYVVSPHLRPDDGYAVTLEASPVPPLDLLEATVTLCDFGLKGIDAALSCKEAGEAGANPKPLFTNPTRCGEPPVTTLRVNSWPHPDVFSEKKFTNAPITGCDKVKFEPSIGFQPSSRQADSPTGIDVSLTMPTDGLEDPNGIAQANLKRARVTLPEGMSVNATAGQGLGACTAEQIGFNPQGVPNDAPVACPDASKIGTVAVDTPLLGETLNGDVYIAKQGDNPFGSLLAVYMVIDSPKNGILVKLAGEVNPNLSSGQLVVTFSDNPEVPFSSVRLHFPQGPRSPLLNPPMCGEYQINTELSPWNAKDPSNPAAEEIVKQTSTYSVTEGPNGGPCPTGALQPKLSAGTQNPVAGSKSPFVLRLHREDGTQRFSAVNVTTPPGLTAYLKGIPYCPDAVLAGISAAAGTGQAQIDNPSCPAASQIGTAIAGAGAGPDPLFVDTGRAYLAGPYKGAPLSLALLTPAVAGPFDLGNVLVRTALRIDPETAQVTAVSDPIPTIVHGILLDIRDVRVALDRPNFTLNPTNCEALSVKAQVKGEQGATANLSNRFQVGGCEKLKFKPKLALRLKGATKRGGHPALRATLSYPPGPGYANVKSASVALPHSEFLDQAHIKTICTRVQFAAKACPPGSIYGHATATTPLLDYPVEGPVYLRSSSNPLPDLVAALRGPDSQPIEVVLDGRIDSVKGGIRSSFDLVPDAPVSKFTLSMQGGKKGLLVNSRDLCAKVSRATASFSAQNGRALTLRPQLKSACAKGKGHKHKHLRHKHH